MRTVIVSLGALALACGPLAAQERIDRSIPAPGAGEVEIINTAGSVVVTGWNRDEVRVTGTLGAGTERLDLEGGRDRATVRVVLPRNGRNTKGSDLQVRVPAGRSVLVRTVSADVEVSNVDGVVTARTTSGDVAVAGRPRGVSASSTSGDVGVEVSETGRVQANSTSGDIRVRGTVRESVGAEAVSGDIEIAARTPEVRAKSVSGDVLLSGVSGRVTASTVSGDARIRDSRVQYGSFETVSGNLRYEGEVARGAALSLQSHSGGVELVLPANAGAEVEAQTFSGDIVSEFGGEPQRTGRYTPGRQLRTTLGSGGGLISAQTFSGTVKLLRR